MVKLDSLIEELLDDPEVMKGYQAQKLEFEIAPTLIEARIAAEMTQSQVAKRMHTSQ